MQEVCFHLPDYFLGANPATNAIWKKIKTIYLPEDPYSCSTNLEKIE